MRKTRKTMERHISWGTWARWNNNFLKNELWGKRCLVLSVVVTFLLMFLLRDILMGSVEDESSFDLATEMRLPIEIEGMAAPSDEQIGGDEQVLVVGVHHSGTSVMAKLMSDMGYYGGPINRMLRIEGDKKDYWEHRKMLALNRQLFRWVGQDSMGYEPVVWEDYNAEQQAIANQTIREVIAELDVHQPWILKEPRVCLTLDIWKRFLPRMVCVMVYRHPYPVTESVGFTDRWPGYARTWDAYVWNSIKQCEGSPTFEVYNDALLKYPRETVIKLFHKLQAMRDSTGARSNVRTLFLPLRWELPSKRIKSRVEKEDGLSNQTLALLHRLKNLHHEEASTFAEQNMKYCHPYANTRQLNLPISSSSPTACGPSFIVIGDDSFHLSSFYHTLESHIRIEMSNLSQHLVYRRPPSDRTLFDDPVRFIKRIIANHPITPGHPFLLGITAPDLFYHPMASQVLRMHLPSLKIILLLRDPIERVYSHYLHHQRTASLRTLNDTQRQETLSFAQWANDKLLMMQDLLAGVDKTDLSWKSLHSHLSTHFIGAKHNNHNAHTVPLYELWQERMPQDLALFLKGIYSVAAVPWVKHWGTTNAERSEETEERDERGENEEEQQRRLGKDQLMAIPYERFLSEPQQVMKEVTWFLGIERANWKKMTKRGKRNRLNSEDVPQEFAAFYKGLNQELARLLRLNLSEWK